MVIIQAGKHRVNEPRSSGNGKTFSILIPPGRRSGLLRELEGIQAYVLKRKWHPNIHWFARIF
jgi:hypothetical protein